MSSPLRRVQDERESEWVRYLDPETGAHYWHNHRTGESRWDETHSENDEREPLTKRHTERPSLPQTHTLTHADEDEDQTSCSWRCSLLAVVFFEGLFACLEACLRVCALLAVLLCYLVVNAVYARSLGLSLLPLYCRIVKDVIATAAAAVTLLLPCSLLCAYRSMSATSDWEMHSLLTVVGRVDPRRFASVSVWGIGAQASNAEAREDELRASPLDSLSDGVLFFPRNALADAQRFLSGETAEDDESIASVED